MAKEAIAASSDIVAVYIRVPQEEIDRLLGRPEILPKYDPRVALGDGRGLDLGAVWRALGERIGGPADTEAGPTAGELTMPDTDSRATWRYVAPRRVAAIAEQLRRLYRWRTTGLRLVDGGDVPDSEVPAGFRDAGPDAELDEALRLLSEHYTAAALRGEAMLIRLGERM